MTAVKLNDFPHRIGAHCSSTSVVNVARYDDVTISEPMAFGLGAGLGFYYIYDPSFSPQHRFNGRAAGLEENFYRHVGVPLSWRERWNPAEMAQVLAQGRPVLAVTDIYHLPYYQPDVHFTGHGVVVVGIDPVAETAAIADIATPEPIHAELDDLRLAMSEDLPPLMAPNQWAAAPVLAGEIVTETAVRDAIRHCTQVMLTPSSEVEGLPAMRRMVDAFPQWGAAEDWVWAARFGYQAIEKRGTGGGGFRRLYGDFLTEAGAFVSGIDHIATEMHALAGRWTALAQAFKKVFVRNNSNFFDEAHDILAEIVEREDQALRALAATVE